MLTLIVIVFVVGYLAIAFEHVINANKTASALLTGVICWSLYALLGAESHLVAEQLAHHLTPIAEILFFLLAAMTIVELVDAHQGFALITDRIKTQNPVVLLWVIALLTFFMSAALDNLTTSIVMISLLRKLLPASDWRKLLAGVVIIAANAGGAWSPIGDVTTTMLWIGGQISAVHIITHLFVPSLVALLVPVFYLQFAYFRKNRIALTTDTKSQTLLPQGSAVMLFLGLGMLLFVPIFKTFTHLPPYMGMLLGLGVVWIASEIIHKDKDEEERKPFTVAHALSKVDASSVLFFLGILLAISALESTHILSACATWLSEAIPDIHWAMFLIGAISAVVDNVPLVAAVQGMYSLEAFAMDSSMWTFLAYCAGTGGSLLIIGSAAGVAVMGMEKIDFVWYVKKVSFLALISYVAGAGVYYLMFLV
ncbi:sodium:proton antiporter NhaD [Hugenholtzia roseola]|uniref:sodium:proton antiporter NhaD n=1 Tax=Hugenholtzia roseola TaxID=1002 RepID=UPI00047E0CE2|nr:sodium:proton antiporter NhaD [Hugenholtzia roseola]